RRWLVRRDSCAGGGSPPALLGLRRVLVSVLGSHLSSMTVSMGILLAFLLLFLVSRRTWAALLGLVGLFALLQVLQSDAPAWLSLSSGLVVFGSLSLVLFRFGLLAVVAGGYVLHLVYALPLVPGP